MPTGIALIALQLRKIGCDLIPPRPLPSRASPGAALDREADDLAQADGNRVADHPADRLEVVLVTRLARTRTLLGNDCSNRPLA